MLWEEISNRAERSGASIRNIFQEEMQKAVLAFLSRKGCFENIVFHGGTALRLFHGNPRFSEGIDLVFKENVDNYDLSPCISKADRFCLDMFPFLTSVQIETQKDHGGTQGYVLRATSDARERSPRLHIELFCVPSYTNRPMILDYPPMQPAVTVEDPAEILSDKVCALALRDYTKGRDLWDVYFLRKERSVEPEWDLVMKKVRDYGHDLSELEKRIEGKEDQVRENGETALKREMERFMPEAVWTSYRHSLEMILGSVSDILTTFREKVEDHVG